jgi:hypothetical protein
MQDQDPIPEERKFYWKLLGITYLQILGIGLLFVCRRRVPNKGPASDRAHRPAAL